MGRKKRGSNLLPNGRNRTARFVKLDHRLLSSSAFRSLSAPARNLLVEMMMIHNGSNNGSLYLSVRDATDRLGYSDKLAVGKMFDELIEAGLVTVTREADFHIKPNETSKARCFRLNFIQGPNRRSADYKCLDWAPPSGTRAQKRMLRGMSVLKRYKKALTSDRLPVLDSNSLGSIPSELGQAPVRDSNTLNSKIGRNASIARGRISGTHTSTTTAGGTLPISLRTNTAACVRGPHWLSLTKRDLTVVAGNSAGGSQSRQRPDCQNFGVLLGRNIFVAALRPAACSLEAANDN